MVPTEIEETAVGWSAIMSALANRHRRRLLMNLLEHNPKGEELHPPEVVHEGEKSLETLQIEFVHVHLPLLEDLGVIHWDREAHTVVTGPQFEEVRPLLALVDEHGDELPDGWV